MNTKNYNSIWKQTKSNKANIEALLALGEHIKLEYGGQKFFLHNEDISKINASEFEEFKAYVLVN